MYMFWATWTCKSGDVPIFASEFYQLQRSCWILFLDYGFSGCKIVPTCKYVSVWGDQKSLLSPFLNHLLHTFEVGSLKLELTGN